MAPHPPLILSCSLNPNSKSRILAAYFKAYYETTYSPINLLDLRDFSLSFCDGTPDAFPKDLKPLQSAIDAAPGVIISVPVYNYGINAALKSVIEFTGKAWSNKIIGFLCSAGGPNSYMSILSIANSLMLDFRTLVIPSFVYAKYQDFSDTQINNTDIVDRIHQLSDTFHTYITRLID